MRAPRRRALPATRGAFDDAGTAASSPRVAAIGSYLTCVLDAVAARLFPGVGDGSADRLSPITPLAPPHQCYLPPLVYTCDQNNDGAQLGLPYSGAIERLTVIQHFLRGTQSPQVNCD